jgi:spore coat polysaccharide biosynthesis predicted glycosyltransferase SpsG/RimJ/RimL family protein N-acetyltransferase
VRILMHCNGGASIGLGHLVRCLALAEEAVAAGHEVVVAGEVDADLAARLLDGAALELRPLARSDPGALRALTAELRPDVVHVDSYDEVEPVRTPGAAPLVSILEDGTFGRRDWADLVVDPGLGAETEHRPGPVPPASLRGIDHAPLRTAVTRRRGTWRLQDPATRVLVVMGGTDPARLTPRVLAALDATGLPLQVTAVTADPGAVPAGLRADLRVERVGPGPALPGLMVGHDLVVSAAGTSVWELCCLGVPMALVCAAENQRPGYDRVVGSGAAVGLGDAVDAAVLREVLTSTSARATLAREAAGVVDGLGSWRVVRAWEQLVVTPPAPPGPGPVVALRPAGLADAGTLLRWRNDPATRAGSRSQDPVIPEEHRLWLATTLDRPDRLLLVASDPDGDVGTVRWDRLAPATWEVSVTVAPERRGRGLAGALLAAGEAYVVGSAGARVMHAVVHGDNPASRRLFESSGYLPHDPADADGFLTYRKHR